MTAKILLGLALLLALFVLVAALQPAAFRIERSIVIAAPASQIFPRLDDLHQFQEWSPWAKLDPAAQVSFEGPTAGTGANYSWSGNSKVGEGKMTIVEDRAPELVRMKLEFLRPMKATNEARFDVRSKESGTVVSWSMTGQKNFVSKAVGLVMNMDKVVGGDFERGLQNLKELSERKK